MDKSKSQSKIKEVITLTDEEIRCIRAILEQVKELQKLYPIQEFDEIYENGNPFMQFLKQLQSMDEFSQYIRPRSIKEWTIEFVQLLLLYALLNPKIEIKSECKNVLIEILIKIKDYLNK